MIACFVESKMDEKMCKKETLLINIKWNYQNTQKDNYLTTQFKEKILRMSFSSSLFEEKENVIQQQDFVLSSLFNFSCGTKFFLIYNVNV